MTEPGSLGQEAVGSPADPTATPGYDDEGRSSFIIEAVCPQGSLGLPVTLGPGLRTFEDQLGPVADLLAGTPDVEWSARPVEGAGPSVHFAPKPTDLTPP